MDVLEQRGVWGILALRKMRRRWRWVGERSSKGGRGGGRDAVEREKKGIGKLAGWREVERGREREREGRGKSGRGWRERKKGD